MCFHTSHMNENVVVSLPIMSIAPGVPCLLPPAAALGDTHSTAHCLPLPRPAAPLPPPPPRPLAHTGIMRMGVACLQLPQERVRSDAGVWAARAAAMVESLRRAGCGEVDMPKACECVCVWGGGAAKVGTEKCSEVDSRRRSACADR